MSEEIGTRYIGYDTRRCQPMTLEQRIEAVRRKTTMSEDVIHFVLVEAFPELRSRSGRSLMIIGAP